jgi:hypothetical protein
MKMNDIIRLFVFGVGIICTFGAVTIIPYLLSIEENLIKISLFCLYFAIMMVFGMTFNVEFLKSVFSSSDEDGESPEKKQ